MSIAKELRELPKDDATLRKFGLTVGLVFTVIGAFVYFRGTPWGKYPLALGISMMGVGWGMPWSLRGFYIAWMAMALVLGSVMTRVLLTIFFLLVLTPVGLFFRLIGRDVLHQRLDKKAPTYWLPKEYPIADRSRFEKFF